MIRPFRKIENDALIERGALPDKDGVPIITWIPTKPSNPSKLQKHFWNGKEWIPTAHVRFVPWRPE